MDAVSDVLTPEQLPAQIHQLGDGAAVADELEQLRCDQRDCLWIVETHSTRETLLREESRLVKNELVEFPWSQVHADNLTICVPMDHLRAATARMPATRADTRSLLRPTHRPCAARTRR